MNDIPLPVLIAALIALLFLSAFFSGAETGVMTLNRYRLRQLVKIRHGGAVRAEALLARPDHFVGLILIGGNFIKVLAASLATVIALRLLGSFGIAVATGVMTLLLLIFSEIAPKTFAALHPERIAFPAAYVLHPLLKVCYPVTWAIGKLTQALSRWFGVSDVDARRHTLSQEELRMVVNEAGALIPRRHQHMLASIVDLERVTVEDIMVPRSDIIGIDLNDDQDAIIAQLGASQHTRLPVYRESIDDVIGILHLRNVLPLLAQGVLNKETLADIAQEPYFIPEGTPLNMQLLNFQRQKKRIGLVVDEYGDIRGLVTLEDILEEIVGEFTTDPPTGAKEVHVQTDGTYLVEGSVNVRELNRMMNWTLPTDGPKTLNGLILEYLEAIPEPGTALRLAGYPIEIIQMCANAVKVAKITPMRREQGYAEPK